MTAIETSKVLEEVTHERSRQDEEYGAEHDDQHNALEWLGLIAHYAGAAFISGMRDGIAFQKMSRAGLIRVAAIAVAAVESIDRSHGEA